ncbi:RNA polymerase sigma factor [Methylobacter marinus]|jgi:RNA polymerase sigma factor (sigma-70 family)|uniref:RNA polymerase sigma factor n=1 Tax=Methylobacter marinus TaxID=34058 RepID=UPI00037BB9C4|nr:RNA polymerase sigma factor [Methylobacter marinus]
MSLLPEQSLSSFFLLHQKDLMQFLTYKVQCAETATDLSQETYLRLVQHRQVDTIENLRAYLFRIANNLALDHLRSRTRQLQREAGPVTDDLVCQAPEPDAALAGRQQLEMLERIIYDLPPKCREVFLMCRVEGKSYAEIGDALSISPRTVESHMRKALEQIRQQFD